MKLALPTLDDLRGWLLDAEDEHLEFKAARQQLDSKKLTRYCVALANERGGHLVLGVSDKRPREVVGTTACRDLHQLARSVSQRIRVHVDATELLHPDGRVVIVTVAGRPIGTPVSFEGAYWMRRGEELVGMPPELLKRVFAEAGPDYSAETCPAATLDDLDTAAIEVLRARWQQQSGNDALANLPAAQLLEDAELTVDGAVTYAALVLLGTRKALGRHLGHAETIYEYRSAEAELDYGQRVEFRRGFLGYLDELWRLIDLRNDVHSMREGLFRREIPTFNEGAVREALLNALAHRDYRLGGSIFVRQWPRRLEIASPGGFPAGITAENLLWKQLPRNRRIAEVLSKCGLVERSGQGANRMFEACVQESKALPDFSGSDDYEVNLVLRGEVLDEGFLAYLEQIGAERLATFTTEDFLALDAVAREQPLDARLQRRLLRLRELGVVETKGRGRGTRYLLSERFYRHAGRRGAYTRKRGLDKATNKELLVQHIARNDQVGSPLHELQEVLPALTKKRVQYLAGELKAEGRIHVVGKTRAARWHAGPETSDATPDKAPDKTPDKAHDAPRDEVTDD